MSDPAPSLTAPPEQILVASLVLTRWERACAPALAAVVAANAAHLQPWMPWMASGIAPTVEEYRERTEEVCGLWDRGEDFLYLVMLAGSIVGGTGLHPRIGRGGLEIGYWIDQDHVGRGFATSVAAALTNVALAMAGIDRVEIHHDRANLVSGRVPQRLGYTNVAQRKRTPVTPGEEGVTYIWRRTTPVQFPPQH